MDNHKIDINCDLGESFGHFKVGQDEAVFPFITSCNIACGFHGGDPLHMEKTISRALKHNVRIGAHPSYPDLAGFGRRKMKLPAEELKAILKYQIAALIGMTESLGGKVAYVKPHGALYNTAADYESEAKAIVEAIAEMSHGLALLGMAGSKMESAAMDRRVPFFAEAFADRKYNEEGRLLSRSLPGSVIVNSKEAAKQVISLVLDREVHTLNDVSVSVKANSICVHGDNVHALAILKEIDKALAEHNISKKAFC
ncbi:MAG: 5-oxoprolinase subunit PxpA [Cyclobacteriaceae bacterium]